LKPQALRVAPIHDIDISSAKRFYLLQRLAQSFHLPFFPAGSAKKQCIKIYEAGYSLTLELASKLGNPEIVQCGF
jgi:hypothetical protein